MKLCAYYQWIDAGKPEGKEMEHWLKAEKAVAEAGVVT